MSTYDINKFRDEYKKKIKTCAEEGIALARGLQMAGLSRRLYLCVTPEREISLQSSLPEDAEYVTGESLPPDLPDNDFYKWVYERARFVLPGYFPH